MRLGIIYLADVVIFIIASAKGKNNNIVFSCRYMLPQLYKNWLKMSIYNGGYMNMLWFYTLQGGLTFGAPAYFYCFCYLIFGSFILVKI